MNIHQFGARAGHGSDTTPAVRAALDALKGHKNARLVFPPGRYDFWPDRAAEDYLFISNNDESLKRIAFLIDGCDGLEIDGQGSFFVFHSLVLPFVIRANQRVRLAHFSMDWARTFVSEARVLESREGENGFSSTDLFIPEAFPFKIEGGQLVFTGEGQDTYALGNALEFDPARRETAFRVHDNFAIQQGHRATEIGPRCVRLEVKFATQPTPGNVLALIRRQTLLSGHQRAGGHGNRGVYDGILTCLVKWQSFVRKLLVIDDPR